MSQSGYEERLSELRTNLVLPIDKPDETHESTLRVLWLAAAEIRMSPTAALVYELPLLAKEQHRRLDDLTAVRLAGKPLAYITGRQDFMGVELVVGPEALIPRRETELLGNTALGLLQEVGPDKVPRCLDVCTGCGNLAIALSLKCPGVQVVASDLSSAAIRLAAENAANHGLQDKLQLEVGDLFAPFETAAYHEIFDLITCNPPYISSAGVPRMATEISDHEPGLAFDGGFGGMAVMKKLMTEAPRFLKSGGWLAFEVGAGQGEAIIRRLTAGSLYEEVVGISDDHGIVRVVTARRSGA